MKSTLIQQPQLRLITVKAKSFPEGIRAAWQIKCQAYSCWNEVCDTELLSPEWDDSFTDLSFTHWLRRMILTDGEHLDPASPDEDDVYVKRIV